MDTPLPTEFTKYNPKRDAAAFVEYWAGRYNDPREELYDEHIGKPLTPDGLRAMFIWKNGGNLSEAKWQSVENNYINRIKEVSSLPLDTAAPRFLDRFARHGAIWGIFFLHCWQPKRYPIFDQHAWRTKQYFELGKIEELDKQPDPQKITLYLTSYMPWFQRIFDGFDPREADRAVWTYGKLLKAHLKGSAKPSALDDVVRRLHGG